MKHTRRTFGTTAILIGALLVQAQSAATCGNPGDTTTTTTSGGDVVTARDDRSTTSPAFAAVVGSYRLTAVNGARLPYRYSSDEDGCREEIVGGSLVIRSNGTFTRAITEREACPDDDIEEETETENGRVKLRNDRLEFDNDGDNAAIIRNGQLDWRTDDYSKPLTLTFRR